MNKGIYNNKRRGITATTNEIWDKKSGKYLDKILEEGSDTEVIENIQESISSLQEEVEDIKNDKQDAFSTVVVNISNDGGDPSGTGSVGEGALTLNLKNIKGNTGEQGPAGDTTIIGDEETYTLYAGTGASTTGAMTQKATTNALNAVAREAFEKEGIYSIKDITPASGTFSAFNNYISPSTGLWVTAGNANNTGYFKAVTPGKLYRFQNPTNGMFQVYFMTSNIIGSSGDTPAFATGESASSEGYSPSSGEPVYRRAPADARYIYVRRKVSSTIWYTEIAEVTTIEESLNATQKELKDTDDKIEGYFVETDTELTNQFSFTDGYYLKADNTTASSSYFAVSNTVDISDYKGKYLRITIPRYNTGGGARLEGYLLMFDDEETPNIVVQRQLEKYAASTSVQTKGDVATYEIYIPEIASSVRTTYYKSNLSQSGITTAPFFCEIVERITGVKENVDGVTDLVFGDDGETILTDRVIWTDLKAVGVAGFGDYSKVVDASAQSVTNVLAVSDFDSIRVTVNKRNLVSTVGCAFYDEEGGRLVSYKPPYCPGAVDSLMYIVYKIPAGAKYFRTTVLTSLKSQFKIFGYKSKTTASVIAELNNKLFYPIIGSPRIYHSASTAAETAFTSVSQLYNAWDSLAATHPNWLAKKADIGQDASETYDIRHYEFGWQHKEVNSKRDRSGGNYWSDLRYKPRRILLNLGTHANEDGALLAGYLSIKEILESSEEWAQFIRANFIIDIVPILNPWGLDNRTSGGRGRDVNSNNVNINRDFDSDTPQSETSAMIGLVQSLIPIGLVGCIDLHNTGTGEESYLVSSSAYKLFPYYARLAMQIQGIMYETLNTYFNSVGEHFHIWDVKMSGEADTSGQLHWYMDKMGFPGITVEVSPTNSVKAARISKDYCINLIQTFGTMFYNLNN